MVDYVSLHNHSSASLLDALPSPKDMFKRALELNQKAIAITDHATFAGVWDAFKAAKEVGIKYIVGCEFYFVNDVANKEEKIRHVILLAKNAVGYRNMLLLNRGGFDHSISYGKKTYPLIDWNSLEKHSDGVICLTACSSGIVAQLLNQKKFEEAKEATKKLIDIFGDNLGLEIQTNNLKRFATAYNDSIEQRFTNYHIIKLAEEFGVRVVPTTNSHYLVKEDAETHDVLLAIGAGQSIYSNARLKYEVPQFYVRSGEEVKEFFSRTNPEDKVNKWIENSLYFADLCEEPAWVDPKHSNPSGKELPEFPVKHEPDYKEYRDWLKYQDVPIKKQEEDKSYLRFKCEKVFLSKVPKGKVAEYQERLEEELNILEFHVFSSYMLIVADFIEWSRKNNITVGPGRGCLGKNTLVLTEKGFKNINNVLIGDKVFTHNGNLKNVINTFEFNVPDEDLIKIKTQNSFGEIILTKDHEVFGKIKNSIKPDWIEAKDLKIGDVLYTPNIKRRINTNKLPKDFTVRFSSTKNSNLDKSAVIKFNSELLYILGRFTGDGWIRTPSKDKKYNSYMFGIAFNSNDTIGISKISNYFTALGIPISSYYHKQKKLVQICVHNKSFVEKIIDFFPNYKRTSSTKHLPIFFRNLEDLQLKILLQGLIDSDGSVREILTSDPTYKSRRISIDSTSYNLICEVKEVLTFLGVPSGVVVRNSFYSGKYLCKESYKIRFGSFNYSDPSKDGFYARITKLENVKNDKVYDITVDGEHSYVTSNFAVHNSVGGSLVGYLLGIHQADPIKYKLIFARFHNKSKISYPDIDIDFASSGRDLVKNYVRNKYGENNVVHVSNINTITPKSFCTRYSKIM